MTVGHSVSLRKKIFGWKKLFLIGTGEFFLVDSKIVLEEEKFKKGTYTLDELPCYKNRYFLRSVNCYRLAQFLDVGRWHSLFLLISSNFADYSSAKFE